MSKILRKPNLFSYLLVVIIIIFLLASINALSKTYAIKDKEGNIVKITNIYQLSLPEKEAGCTISVLVEDTSSKEQFNPSPNGKRTNGIIRVIDGDTIELFLINSLTTIKIRLNGIDCPEKGQPYYEEATTYTSDLCLHKQVGVIKYDKDKYDRLIADIILPDGRNLSEELVRAGFAWWYRLYSDDLILKQLENEARIARRGLWFQPNPIPPWEFRNSDLENQLKKDNNNEKIIINPTIYPNGLKIKIGDSYYYPNGFRLNINSYFYYPNGSRVNIGDYYYYPNYQRLNIGNQYYYSNGNRVNIGRNYYSHDGNLLSSPPEYTYYNDGKISCSFFTDFFEKKPYGIGIGFFYNYFTVTFYIHRGNVEKVDIAIAKWINIRENSFYDHIFMVRISYQYQIGNGKCPL